MDASRSPDKFRGRAIMPIEIEVEANNKIYGALCFDVRRPLIITNEERLIMASVANKISQLIQTSLPVLESY